MPSREDLIPTKTMIGQLMVDNVNVVESGKLLTVGVVVIVPEIGSIETRIFCGLLTEGAFR